MKKTQIISLKNLSSSHRKPPGAFTLVELLVVIAIIAVLEQNGASCEWNAHDSGRPVDSPRRDENLIAAAPLMYDYQNFRSDRSGGAKNVLLRTSTSTSFKTESGA